jgi:hypothetical protein
VVGNAAQIGGVKGVVHISSLKKEFVYTCTFGGETLTEGNEAVGASAGDPTVRVEVQLGEFAADESGAQVVWYRIRTLCQFPGAPERVIVLHRRFKEFCAVDEQVRVSLWGCRSPSLFRKMRLCLVAEPDPLLLQGEHVADVIPVVATSRVQTVPGAPRLHVPTQTKQFL